jgi:16S rRNA G966 N2-methylase RsmD
MPEWALHHGDALTVLPTLDTLVDAVIVDPPYNSGGLQSAQRRGQSARAAPRHVRSAPGRRLGVARHHPLA